MNYPIQSDLKNAINEAGIKIYILANKCGISPYRFSRILSGITKATDEERIAISDELGLSDIDLFMY